MEKLFTSIDKKLTVITALLLENKFNKDNSLNDQDIISYLHEMKFANHEIAEIMNKSKKQIIDQLYNMKRKKNK